MQGEKSGKSQGIFEKQEKSGRSQGILLCEIFSANLSILILNFLGEHAPDPP